MLPVMATSSEPQSRAYGRWALAWAPVIAWAALIFLASAQSDLRFVQDVTLDLVVRKLGHAAVFGILALLLWRAISTTTACDGRGSGPWPWRSSTRSPTSSTRAACPDGIRRRSTSPSTRPAR
jgi:hypothetical protein